MTILTESLWGRRITAGVLTWLIPFLVAIPFYSKDGSLLIDTSLFKSLMIVVSSLVAAVLIVWFFRTVKAGYTHEAVATGITWLVLNWILDLIVLVGILGMALPDYVAQIGLRYLMIPAIVIAAGIVADEAVRCGAGK